MIRETQSKTTTKLVIWLSSFGSAGVGMVGLWVEWLDFERYLWDPVPEHLGRWAITMSPSPEVTTNIELQVAPFVYNMKSPAQWGCGPLFHLWVDSSPPPSVQAWLLLRFTNRWINTSGHTGWNSTSCFPVGMLYPSSLPVSSIVAQSWRLTHPLSLLSNQDEARSRGISQAKDTLGQENKI